MERTATGAATAANSLSLEAELLELKTELNETTEKLNEWAARVEEAIMKGDVKNLAEYKSGEEFWRGKRDRLDGLIKGKKLLGSSLSRN